MEERTRVQKGLGEVGKGIITILGPTGFKFFRFIGCMVVFPIIVLVVVLKLMFSKKSQ